METLRDSLVGGRLKRGEDDPTLLLGFDEMYATSPSNTLLLLSKSGVAELRRRDAKLASSPPPSLLWELPIFDLLPAVITEALTSAGLGVALCNPESFLIKMFSLLAWDALEWCFPLSWPFNDDTLLCFEKLDVLSLFLGLWWLLLISGGWLTDL